jgi:regulator of protease activity HflC (stomatin/prohibitin superfamily)
MSDPVTRVCKYFVLAFVVLALFRAIALTTVEPGEVGVRYNNVSGLFKKDLQPGWHLEILGVQRVSRLPSRYLLANYTERERLSIRTKDNNTVDIEVTIPYRIKPGRAHKVMQAGNHVRDPDGRFRFQRIASDTIISVLREDLAQLRSQDFYNTDRRLAVCADALRRLNNQLRPQSLEASSVLIRGIYFRDEYELQLARIQLNSQQKLLDHAKQAVAERKQRFDSYEEQTNALAASRVQEWLRKIADLERAYHVGFVDTAGDSTPGAARRALAALTPEARAALVTRAAEVLGVEESDVSEGHLLGISNIQAETGEYSRRVRTQAEAVSARLDAEGAARLAAVRGAYETRLNALMNSAGGRAYVAHEAAAHVTFSETLSFHSQGGIPSVLRLKDFAEQFMGQ